MVINRHKLPTEREAIVIASGPRLRRAESVEIRLPKGMIDIGFRLLSDEATALIVSGRGIVVSSRNILNFLLKM
jgi:hypothetical protein